MFNDNSLSKRVFNETIANEYSNEFYSNDDENKRRDIEAATKNESVEKLEMLKNLFCRCGSEFAFFDSHLPSEDCECLVYYGDSNDIRFFDKLYYRADQRHFYFDVDCKNESTIEEYGNYWYAWLKLPCSVTSDGKYSRQ